MGQQIAIGALTFGIGFTALVFVFRIRSFKEVIRRGREDRAAEDERPPRGPRPARGRGAGPGELSGAGLGPEALARLAHEDHGLREDEPHGLQQVLGLLLGVALEVEPLDPATLISTASLIALSAHATFWAPCICSANSPMRRRSSSGSPKRPPKGIFRGHVSRV